MKAALFKKAPARSASMRAVMLRYTHAFFDQVATPAALAVRRASEHH
jgi:hypothetical protein